MHIKDPNLIKNIPIFQELSTKQIQKIINAPENGIEVYNAKENVIREQEIGNCMYIILEGAVEIVIRGTAGEGVLRREITIATLRSGDFFGDKSLVEDVDGRRNASVRTIYPSTLFRIDKKYILLHVKKELGDDRQYRETMTDVLAKKTNSRNIQLDMNRLMKTMMRISLFQSLKPNELLNIDKWTNTFFCGPGEFVIREAEPANCLYVLMEGTVEVFTFDENGKIVLLNKLKPGDYFGEQALLFENGTRSAYVRTNGYVQLTEIRKERFRIIINRNSKLKSNLAVIGKRQRATISQIHTA